jgi:hypothetical protein
MNTTLFPQNLGFAMMLLWFGVWYGEYSPWKSKFKNQKSKLIVMTLFNMIIASIHVFTWIIMVMISIIYMLININDNNYSKNKYYWTNLIKESLITYTPIAILAIIYMLIYSFDTLYYIFNPYSTQLDFSRLLNSSSKDTIILISLLMLFPIVILKYNHLNLTKILVSWISAIGLLTLFTGFPRPHRFLMLEPVPILSALILVSFLNSSDMRIRPSMHEVFVGALLFSQIFSFLPMAYNPIEVSRPNEDVITEFRWIKEQYGFSNPSTNVYINSRKPVDYEWGLALIGDPLYVGSDFRVWYNGEYAPWEDLRKVDLNIRFPGAIYSGSIYTATKVTESANILVPESTINLNETKIIDYIIIKNSTYIEEPGIFVVDVKQYQNSEFSKKTIIRGLENCFDHYYLIENFDLVFPSENSILFDEFEINIDEQTNEISFFGPTRDWIILESKVNSDNFDYVVLNGTSDIDLNLAIFYSDGKRKYHSVALDEYGLFSSKIDRGNIDKIRISIPPKNMYKDYSVTVNYAILTELT